MATLNIPANITTHNLGRSNKTDIARGKESLPGFVDLSAEFRERFNAELNKAETIRTKTGELIPNPELIKYDEKRIVNGREYTGQKLGQTIRRKLQRIYDSWSMPPNGNQIRLMTEELVQESLSECFVLFEHCFGVSSSVIPSKEREHLAKRANSDQCPGIVYICSIPSRREVYHRDSGTWTTRTDRIYALTKAELWGRVIHRACHRVIQAMNSAASESKGVKRRTRRFSELDRTSSDSDCETWEAIYQGAASETVFAELERVDESLVSEIVATLYPYRNTRGNIPDEERTERQQHNGRQQSKRIRAAKMIETIQWKKLEKEPLTDAERNFLRDSVRPYLKEYETELRCTIENVPQKWLMSFKPRAILLAEPSQQTGRDENYFDRILRLPANNPVKVLGMKTLITPIWSDMPKRIETSKECEYDPKQALQLQKSKLDELAKLNGLE